MKWWELRGTVRKGGPATRGYRLVGRKPYRGWLLHRAIADLLVREWNPFGWESLPAEVEIHHLDWDRGNCPPWNLLILTPELHHYLQRAAPRCPYTGRYLAKEAPMTEEDEAYLREIAGLPA